MFESKINHTNSDRRKETLVLYWDSLLDWEKDFWFNMVKENHINLNKVNPLDNLDTTILKDKSLKDFELNIQHTLLNQLNVWFRNDDALEINQSS